MAIGMTYEQYWYDDPLLVRAFYKAERIRQERTDQEAWLHGSYMLQAIDATVGNMFRKSGQQPSQYPQEPLSTKLRREKEKAKDEVRKEREAVWAMAWMSSFVEAGKNWGKRKG